MVLVFCNSFVYIIKFYGVLAIVGRFIFNICQAFFFWLVFNRRFRLIFIQCNDYFVICNFICFFLFIVFKISSDNCYIDFFIQFFIIVVILDQVCIVISFFLYEFGDFEDFVYGDFFCIGSDIEQDMLCFVDVVIFKQWRMQCVIYSLFGLVFFFSGGSIYNGYIVFVYNGVDVFKVYIYVVWYCDDFCDVFGCCSQDVVCFCKSIRDGQVVMNLLQFIIGDDNQGIDVFFQFFQAFRFLRGMVVFFKSERQCNDIYGKDIYFFGCFGNDWSCICICIIVYVCCDKEYVVVIFQISFNGFNGFFIGYFVDIWF